MYYATTAGLGFSLRPPKIIRKIGSAVVGVVKTALPLASVFIPGVGPAVIAAVASQATASNPTPTDKTFLSQVSRGLVLPPHPVQAQAQTATAQAMQAMQTPDVAPSDVFSSRSTLLIGGALLAVLALSSGGSRRRRSRRN